MKRGNQRKFGRELQQRAAFIRSLLTALVTHGKVKTTVARAKTMKVEADKLVTLARRPGQHGRRLLVSRLGATAATKLSGDILPKLAERNGGYTRVVKLPRRTSDGSAMAIIEFVS